MPRVLGRGQVFLASKLDADLLCCLKMILRLQGWTKFRPGISFISSLIEENSTLRAMESETENRRFGLTLGAGGSRTLSFVPPGDFFPGMARIRQSRPDSGLDVQVKELIS
jgi:hypothetical protein